MIEAIQKKIPFSVALLAILSYLLFFDFSFIPYIFKFGVNLVVPLLALALVLIKIIYNPERTSNKRYATLLIIMIVTSLISFIPAKFFHNQNYLNSFWANKLIYYYFIYFFLHEFRVDPKLLEKTIIYIGIATIGFYYAQLAIYPTRVFDITIMEDRNTLRMFFPSMLCSNVAYLYFLNRAFNERKWYLLSFCLAIFSIYIVQATRQVIFTFFIITIIYTLRSGQIHNKLIIVFLMVMLIVSSIVLFEGIIRQMIDITYEQAQTADEYIRVRAAKYFLTRGTPSDLAYILGNGPPDASSPYGLFLAMRAIKNGFHLSDIGIIGDYYKHGIIFILVGLIIFYRSLRHKVTREYKYWNYYVLSIILVLFTGAGYLGDADINFIIGLYIMDTYSVKKHNNQYNYSMYS